MFFHLSLPQTPGDHKRIGNILPSSENILLAQMAKDHQGLVVVVTPDTSQAIQLQTVLSTLTTDPVIFFPDWEILPYDLFSPHQDIISQRLSALSFLTRAKRGIFIVPMSTLMQKVLPPEYLQQNVFLVKKGDELNLTQLRENLIKSGYRAVEQVLSHGEFAVRGALLDLFPMGSNAPFRLDFFDDEVDSIRTFDVDSQRSLQEIDEIRLLPAHEFPINDSGIEAFRRRFRETFGEIRHDPEHIYQQISKGTLPAGIEYWQPLFFDEMATLFDYLAPNTLMVTWQENHAKGERFWADANERFENRRVDPMRPLLPPERLWLSVENVNLALKNFARISLQREKFARNSTHQHNLPIAPLPDLALQAQHKQPLVNLDSFLSDFKGKTLFIAESAGRRETLLELLSPLKLNLAWQENIAEPTDERAICISPLAHGFIMEKSPNIPAWAIICETELFGEKVQARQTRTKSVNPDLLIRNLAELKIGQPVVHLEQGIGRYQGLTFIENAGILAEFLVLEYANDAKLYVPVANLHLITRYVGGADEQAPLHKLGSDAWAKSRAKAVEKIRDVAAQLLDVYAQREIKAGFQFAYDREAFSQFSASFPFEETEDQQRAINAVISDMTQPKAMDRLVCGDVGFGKTEVAIRAAFLAVMNGKQVAMLVPTTLLAKQHYETLLDRFAEQGVNVAMLSRFNSSKADKKILADLADGKVDILVGTHKLLQEDVKFKDLGLLIIDEEHRFGVRQKEKIKQLRANVDILTLTATPIPRTLNMAMNGIRDLSIISTPPARRLTVKTFVRQMDDLLVREAILREIMRGGQVYYLHNDVASIENCAEHLAKLVPEARIAIGHGQMRKRELERVMTDFHHQRFNLLVCSTIIETGIDIPTANTIIIERADKFGLAQLHQLRGRVGRSHHQAYAYLLTPPPKLLSKDARKRLEALESLDTLGAGFLLATQDLEIRGAGELLGDDQSGQIESIGFSLYMDLLENAVTALRAGKEPTLSELTSSQAEIELHLPALIPDDYLGDVNMRLSFYKRIASATDQASLDELRVELVDRFGLLPNPTKNLFNITTLRFNADKLGIKRIQAHKQGGTLEFSPDTKVDPSKLIALISEDPSVYQFASPTKFRFQTDLDDPTERIAFIENLLKTLSE